MAITWLKKKLLCHLQGQDLCLAILKELNLIFELKMFHQLYFEFLLFDLSKSKMELQELEKEYQLY